MEIYLRGNSPSTMTAGIMLLSRARQLGYPITVIIEGDADDVEPVRGPAVVYAPVLASCGVGRDHGSGATVVIPGPPGEPLMLSVVPHGTSGWFHVDRDGTGVHAATIALQRLSTDPRKPAKRLARELLAALATLGMGNEPAVLDVLFGAPAPPLLRLALALRAGRAFSEGRGEAVTRYLSGGLPPSNDPIEPNLPPALVVELITAGRLQWVFDRLHPSVRVGVENWVNDFLTLARDDGGRDLDLLVALVEICSHLAQLPAPSILPPLGAAEDSVAVGIISGVRADGDGDANRQLQQLYRFLGGRFVDHAESAYEISQIPAPDTGDRKAAWQWFSAQARIGRKKADELFEFLFHS